MMTFKTLLQREWMQHSRGWLILCAVPMALVLLALSFGSVQMDGTETPTPMILGMSFAYTLAVTMLGWLSVAFQSSGLARRDVQDRSIEFWRSLPVSDVQSLGATVLAHLMLAPLLVLLLSAVCGLVLAPLMVARVFGFHALLDLPWGALGATAAVGLPRMILGVLLASLWAAPLLLLGMAASAWLKRWGVPVAAVAIGAGGAILKNLYGLPWLLDTVHGLTLNFMYAMVPGRMGQTDFEGGPFPAGVLDNLPGWLMHDAVQALGDLLSPLFLVAVAVSAASFALLVLKRRRG